MYLTTIMDGMAAATVVAAGVVIPVARDIAAVGT